MSCNSCKFFHEEEDECRAHPPTVTASDPDGSWPSVSVQSNGVAFGRARLVD